MARMGRAGSRVGNDYVEVETSIVSRSFGGGVEIWEQAIREWMRATRRTHNWSDETRRTRRQHLETAARSMRGSPWEVDDDRLCAWWSTRTWATETRRAHQASHRAFWSWAVQAGHIEQSPAEALPRARPGLPRPRPTPQEVVDVAYVEAKPRELLMVRLARECGMRRAEVAAAHTRDLVRDLIGWAILVHGKGGRERLVPLDDDLSRVLLALPSGYFFPGKIDGHLSPRYVGKLVRELLAQEWTMHTLRHRFATDAHDVDHDLAVVQELLGHASIATTRNYVFVPGPRLRSTVVAVSAAQKSVRERRLRTALR